MALLAISALLLRAMDPFDDLASWPILLCWDMLMASLAYTSSATEQELPMVTAPWARRLPSSAIELLQSTFPLV
jgi:hypothetical protein